jgi:hypothetical protein
VGFEPTLGFLPLIKCQVSAFQFEYDSNVGGSPGSRIPSGRLRAAYAAVNTCDPWWTWRESNSRTSAYKAPAAYQPSSYTSTQSGGCGQIRTDYLALVLRGPQRQVFVVGVVRRLLIRMSFAATGEGGRTRTSGSGFLPHGRMSAGTPCRPAVSRPPRLHPHFQRAIKNPA